MAPRAVDVLHHLARGDVELARFALAPSSSSSAASNDARDVDAAVREVVEHLWREDTGAAIAVLAATEWRDARDAARAVIERVRFEALNAIAGAYERVTLRELAARCAFDETEATRACATLGWACDDARGVVRPVIADGDSRAMREVSAGDVLARCTEMVARLDA